jgi:hypothetical protein
MSKGDTIYSAFNKAKQQYPLISQSVKFVGDQSLRVNDCPNTPATPSGPSSGVTGTSYTYSSNAIDINGHQVYFMFDWGDGTNSGWIGQINSGAIGSGTYTWNTQGTYQIKVKAKDTCGAESPWSSPLPVNIPRSKQYINTIIQSFFENHQSLFDLIQQIYQY